MKSSAPLGVGAPHSPLFPPPEAPPRPLSDVFFLLQKLPTLSHKANASEINQLSILSDSVCEIAVYRIEQMVLVEYYHYFRGYYRFMTYFSREAKAVPTPSNAARFFKVRFASHAACELQLAD